MSSNGKGSPLNISAEPSSFVLPFFLVIPIVFVCIEV